MDYLLQNGKKLCPIKIKSQSGRVRPNPSYSVSFPKTISFCCVERPLPDEAYELKLRGAGVAALRIKSVGGVNAPFYVTADVLASEKTSDTRVSRIISRNRRIPGRATGNLAFVLKWPSGSATCPFATSFHNANRLFTERLRLVPLAERDSVTAHFDAEVRKAGGGVRRIKLATWIGTEPLPNFFRAARLALRYLPKEADDQKKTAPVEFSSLPFK
ncbi:MAG: hypothetical protein HY298_10460 [Verrucomicrobia bacterium]|nr:hypothetical protein [Verrucomicrobiota bacterium]